MAEQARHLYIVDPATGEQLDECPSCADLQTKLDELSRKFNGLLGQLGKLRAELNRETERNERWPHGLAVFRYWQQKMSHPRAEFSTARYLLVEPFLARGFEDCREAIDGCHGSDFHMKRGIYESRKGPVHDGFDLIFRNDEKFEAFREMAPVQRQPFRKRCLEDHCAEVASRVLERARLIEEATDPGTLASLLAEIHRLNLRWLATPDEYVA